jgi:YD repeat-containing protein
MDLTLFHNSQTNYSAELGNGFSWSYELYVNNLTGNPVVHYGNGLSIPYTSSGGGSPTFTPPAGIYDQLVENMGSTWTLTDKDQNVYQFNAAGFCTSLTDRNGNAITFTLNANNYVTKVTDPTGRYYSFVLDGSNRYTSVTDSALGRTWSFAYNGSNDLQTVTWPDPGDGNVYTDQFTYVRRRGTRILPPTRTGGARYGPAPIILTVRYLPTKIQI